MDKDFWLKAWEEGRTRFHNQEPNTDLVQYFPLFKDHVTEAFVPLCGKSIDLHFLHQAGLEVTGVELSPLAIDQFKQDSKERDLSWIETELSHHLLSQADSLNLYCGDLFELPAEVLESVDFIYDRAAIVALPPELRLKYASWIKETFKQPHQILLISFEYDQALCDGPPFSVTEAEINQLFSDCYSIDLLDRRVIDDINPKFVEANVKKFERTVYQLKSL